MNRIPIVLVDDTPIKQKWFLAIVEWLNGRPDTCYFFDPFWRDTDSATRCSRDAAELLKALQLDDAIYLIDLKLDETAEQAAALRSVLQGSGDARLQSAAATYQELREAHDRANPMTRLVEVYPISMMCLMAAKNKARPAMLVSSLAITADATRARDAHLASVSHDAFPHEVAPEDSPANLLTSQLELWGNRILALLDPFERIRQLTGPWFGEDNREEDWCAQGLPHNLPTARSATLPKAHEACVRQVFGWLPQDLRWWDTQESAHALHESLKTFCGKHAGWMGRHNDYPLSLAGAYLVFLMAIYARAPQQLSRFCEGEWRSFFKPVQSPRPAARSAYAFAPPQERVAAERTLRCLYDFFLTIMVRNDNGQFGIRDVKLPSNSNPTFCIKLAWSPTDIGRFHNAVASRVSSAFSPGCDTLALPASKAPGAYLRYLIASQASSCGFGAPGVIRLTCNPDHSEEHRGWLIIGSSYHDHR